MCATHDFDDPRRQVFWNRVAKFDELPDFFEDRFEPIRHLSVGENGVESEVAPQLEEIGFHVAGVANDLGAPALEELNEVGGAPWRSR
ncbi:MAG: hypothetical protein UZ18_ATM001000915 [Armatimonadetes bacterium OLB18]|nr:MAG: hypothetical protein UZ18_ATM001000915 [Armatimonadetes bacterium OLB18]